MDADVLVRDYLGRLEAAAAATPGQSRRGAGGRGSRAHRRGARGGRALRRGHGAEHPRAARVAGGDRRRGGRIVPDACRGGRCPSRDGGGGTDRRWGPVEMTAVVLLCLAWPAIFLPFGPILWLGLGATGLVLVWVSGVWTHAAEADLHHLRGRAVPAPVPADHPGARAVHHRQPRAAVPAGRPVAGRLGLLSEGRSSDQRRRKLPVTSWMNARPRQALTISASSPTPSANTLRVPCGSQ